MSERPPELLKTIRQLNRREESELEQLGQVLTAEGDAELPEPPPSLLQRLRTTLEHWRQGEPRRKPTLSERRDFMARVFGAGMYLGMHATLGPVVNAFGGEREPREPVAEPEFRPDQELQSALETLLAGRTAGFYLQRREVATGRVLDTVQFDQERRLPVASAFKAFVLAAYLDVLPTAEWQFDRGSAIYNMIVYSHNSATGEILHQVAARLRQMMPADAGRNDLELFNDYLERLHLPRMIGSWGFNSPTQGQQDQTAYAEIQSRGRVAQVANSVTAAEMAGGYAAFVDHFRAEGGLKLEIFKYLLSLRDLRFLSPLENALPQYQLYSKDGYLTTGTFPGIGSARVDAGFVELPDGSEVIVQLATFDESDAVLPQVADFVRQYLALVAPTDQHSAASADQDVTSLTRQLSPEARELIMERHRYHYSGLAELDQVGPLPVDEEHLRTLQEMSRGVGQGEVGAVITVNLFSGEVAIHECDDHGQLEQTTSFLGLVGERLPYHNQSVAETMAASRFADQGYFDPEHGTYFHQRPNGPVPQHTLTTPMVALIDSTSALAGFGDLNTNRPVPYVVMQAITGTTESGYALSETNSEVTMHAIPQLYADEAAFAHYSGREQILTRANQYYGERLPLQDGHDGYWSHGCINLLSAHFERITEVINHQRQQGKKVAMILGYHGYRDPRQLSLPYRYHLPNYPFQGRNFNQSTGVSFGEISR